MATSSDNLSSKENIMPVNIDPEYEKNHVICYNGKITEVLVASNIGIYVIDDKIQLYITMINLLKENFKKGDGIFLSNVHLIIVESQKFLVCCMKSEITNYILEPNLEENKSKLLKEHKLCFPDLFLKNICINFNSNIVKQFLWNLFYNYYLKITWHGFDPHKFFSTWHPPDICQEPFSETFSTPSISFLISDAKRKIIWSKHSTRWDHCIVPNNSLYAFIGFLHLMDNGCFAISDSYSLVPCVFLDNFEMTIDINERQFMCNISSGAEGYYVVLKKYYFVFEKFDGHAIISYICTSISEIVILEKCFSPVIIEKKLSPSLVVMSNKFNSQKNIYLWLEFEVRARAWSSRHEKIVFSKAFVYIHREKIISMNKQDFMAFSEFELQKKYGISETDELSKLMQNLAINSRITILNFLPTASKSSSNLLPLHRYSMLIPYVKSMCKEDLINIDGTVKIFHSSECLKTKVNGSHLMKNVTDIIVNKSLRNTDIIQGILLDKSFGTDSTSKILCITLKDVKTNDIIKIYVSCYPKVLFGLLPGAFVQVIGSTCCLSQKGNVYLKFADFIGIHVSSINYTSINRFGSNVNENENGKDIFWLKSLCSADCPPVFECLNGVFLKIFHAQIDLICVECFKTYETKCVCGVEYMHFIETSFHVDDGTHCATIHGSGNVLRKLLKISEIQWNTLISHVHNTKRGLKFNYVDKSVASQSFGTKLFYRLCCNPALTRPVNLTCFTQTVFDGKKSLAYSCICQDVSEFQVQKVLSKLYLSIQK